MIGKTVSRREFFGEVAKLATGAALGVTLVGVEGRSEAKEGTWPWPYVQLDVEAVKAKAYKIFPKGHCMYAAFGALVLSMREKGIDERYKVLPLEMMEYGKGGLMGWGTLCGALNGAAAFISLVSKDYGKLIDQLVGWYVKTPLPIYRPVNPKIGIKAQSIAGSPLCHVSVTKWCKTSGFGSKSPQRVERCRRLAADVAAKTAELLNKALAGKGVPLWSPSKSVKGCLKCHGPKGEVKDVFGKMECLMCHPGMEKSHY